MHRIVMIAAIVVAFASLVALGGRGHDTTAQESAPDLSHHPLVGSWLVDTDTSTETDAPEFGIWTSDGIMIGIGSSSSSGTWQALDERTGLVSFVAVFPDGSGYTVVRGPHTVDDAGETWTAPFSWTVVGPDGTVLDSGESAARGIRIQEDLSLAATAPYGAGTALAVMPVWTPAPAATPTR